MSKSLNAGVETALHNKSSETTDKGYERASSILAMARAILAAEGVAGLTMRTVAARAGINLSTLQHYYPSKDTLLEALLLNMRQEYQAAIDRIVASGAGNARMAQFEAVVDYLLQDLSSVESGGVIRELWALSNRNAFAVQIVDQMLTRARKVLRNLIRDLNPELSSEESEIRGALVLAQLQGLTLFLASSRPHHAELKGLRVAARTMILELVAAPPGHSAPRARR